MTGNTANKQMVEEELQKIVNNLQDIDSLFGLLTSTPDLGCTLFIGLELLTKTYVTDSKIGANGSTVC